MCSAVPGQSLRSSDVPIAQGEALGMCDANLTIRPGRGGGRWICQSAAPTGAEMHCLAPGTQGFTLGYWSAAPCGADHADAVFWW